MNENPQAIKFTNGRLRPMADTIYSAYLSSKSVVNQWIAQGTSGVFPLDNVLIDDGSQKDGRSPITDLQANLLMLRCYEFVNWMEKGNLAGSGVVTNTILNAVVAVQVNGQSRF